jgi:hypothetical protein
MAGVIAFLGEPNLARVEAAARRLKFFDEETLIISEAGFSAAWVGHDDAALFAPAFDPRTRVRVITAGRVSWDEPDWKRAEGLCQYEGGLSNRLLLQLYLDGGAGALTRHNGPAALFVWDPRQQVLHLWTDHFGYHPVFLYRPENPDSAVISTFAEAIADDPAVSVTRDPVAMAEFLSAWRITPPHTYYREIKYAGAATHLTWDLSRRLMGREEYWKPYQQAPFPNIEAAAEELACAVSHAVRIRTLPRLGPIVSYTSGGMDSRAVLFAAASQPDIIGLNLYDVPNKEAAISRRLCETSGARYVGFARDEDYYPRWLSEGARLSGAMWSAEDNHFLGTHDHVRSIGARTVITACTTDWLFKGYGLEKTYARMLGRNLPIKVFTHERVNGFLPNAPRKVPLEFKSEVAGRLEEWFSGTPQHLKTDADWLAVEDRRVRPACYAVSVSGQIMYRMFPYDTFLADVRVADCYARCRAEWKINADLWGKAVNLICAGATHIEDANFGWRIGSSTPAKLAAFAVGWVGRRLRPPKHGSSGLATDGSWPNLGWYPSHSPIMKEMWQNTPLHTRELIAQCWGSNPWDTPLEAWSSAPNDLFRLLTLACHINRT